MHKTHGNSQATQRHAQHTRNPEYWSAPTPKSCLQPQLTHTPPPSPPIWTHTTARLVTHSHSHTNTNLLLDIFKPRLVLLLWQPPQTHCHSNLTSAFQAPNPGGLQGPNQRPEEGAATPSAIIHATPGPPPQGLQGSSHLRADREGLEPRIQDPPDQAKAPLNSLFPPALSELYGGAHGAKVSLPLDTHKPGFESCL